MDASEAARVLEDEEVVPVAQANLIQGKELLAVCLDADIPVVLGGDPGCKSGGCSPRVVLYARESDIPRLRTLLEARWAEMLRREGTVPPPVEGSEAEGEPPCPACGTSAPLVDGACSDCGLQLA